MPRSSEPSQFPSSMYSSDDHLGIQSFRTSMVDADKVVEQNGVPMESKVIRPDNLTETREFAWYRATYGQDKTLTDFATHIVNYSGVYPEHLIIHETFNQAYEAAKAYLEEAKSKTKS